MVSTARLGCIAWLCALLCTAQKLDCRYESESECVRSGCVWTYGLCANSFENAIAYAENDPGSGDEDFEHDNVCDSLDCGSFQYCDETRNTCVCHHTHVLNNTTNVCDLVNATRGMVFIDLLYEIDLSDKNAAALARVIRDAAREHFTNHPVDNIHVTSMHSVGGKTIFNLTIPLDNFDTHDLDAAILEARNFLDYQIDFTLVTSVSAAHNGDKQVAELSYEVHNASGVITSSTFTQPTHAPNEEDDKFGDSVWWALGGVAVVFMIAFLSLVLAATVQRAKGDQPIASTTGVQRGFFIL